MRRNCEIVIGRAAKTFPFDRRFPKPLQRFRLAHETPPHPSLSSPLLPIQNHARRLNLRPSEETSRFNPASRRSPMIRAKFPNLAPRRRMMNRERSRVMVRMSALVRMRHDHVRLQLREKLGQTIRDLHQPVRRFLIRNPKFQAAIFRNPRDRHRLQQFRSARLFIPLPVSMRPRSPVRHVNYRRVANPAQLRPRPDSLVIRMRGHNHHSSLFPHL